MTENDIRQWIMAKNKLNTAKTKELELRKIICDYILDGKVKGSKKSIIGVFTLTATAKLNNRLDKKLLAVLWPDLSAVEKSCIKFEPSVIAKEYNIIDNKSNIHRAITSTPGTPTLTIK